MCTHVSMGVNVSHVFAEAQGHQQRVSDYLKLDLQAIVGHHVGAGTIRTARTVSIFKI